MSHTLISFLGKARKGDGGKYRTANYDFQGELKTTQFFGLGLKEIIQPDTLIILGTTGSMWDVFYEAFAESEQQADHWMALSESVLANQVSESQLATCAIDLSEKLGLECILKIIPYGMNEQEQSEILKIMAGDVHSNEHVSLDLTHGLRHLPMLGLLSAMYLKTAKQVSIEGIYSGALELTKNNITPVIRLDGLLKISSWINALDGFDKTGDIAPFSDLLQQEGMEEETANLLKEAAFHEGVLNIPSAIHPLKEFSKKTENTLPGIADLFKDSLSKRINWKEEKNIYLCQREKALFYLNQGDYVRAAALGYEATITRQFLSDGYNSTIGDFDERQDAKEDLEYELRKQRTDLWEQYKLLRNIRNSLVHANRVDQAKITKIFRKEDDIRKNLTDLFKILLPKNMN